MRLDRAEDLQFASAIVTGRQAIRFAQHHAAPHRLVVELRQVQRHAFAGPAFGGVLAVDLHPAHAAGQTGGQQMQRDRPAARRRWWECR